MLDAEGKCALEAAIGPLSAPRPGEGVADLRDSGQRRADALVELVRRAVAAAESVPISAKAQVFVTMKLDDLVDRLGAGATVGGLGSGTLLAPETVRRLACDAGIVPVVLGSKGEVLELGRTVRWFTAAQAKALWLRDGSCTFPGCAAPAHGRMRITCGTSRIAVPPTSGKPRCCAASTTPTCTRSASWARSHRAASSGTSRPGPTTSSWPRSSLVRRPAPECTASASAKPMLGRACHQRPRACIAGGGRKIEATVGQTTR